MDAQQELFTRLKLDIEALGFAVYDGELPSKDTKYPFVYLADFTQNNTLLKNAMTGTVFPTIHVWHNTPKQRGTVSRIIALIYGVCMKIESTNNFAWVLANCNSRIITDTTTNAPLQHGIIEPEFKFT